MSDETAETPAGEPSEAPTTPSDRVGEPVTAQPVDAESGTSPAAEAPTLSDAESPTVAAPPQPGTAQAAPPGAPASPALAGAPAAADRGRGVFVPAWVAVVVGVLVVAGLGFAIGWIAAPDDDSSPANAVAGQPVPDRQNPNGQNQLPGQGNGSGQNGPNLPRPGNNGDDSATPPVLRGAYLGVSVESAANESGATISSVAEGGPAADAGLEQGDVVTAVDGEKVASALDLVRQIRQHEIDDTVTVTYTRSGSSAETKVTLESRPTSQSVS